DWFPTIGYYPKSLLGTDVEPISNAYPPTVPFMAMAFWSIGVVMLLRNRLGRWLQHRGPWRATIVVNGVIMTLFLWHMTAYLLAVLVLWPLGLVHQLAHDLEARGQTVGQAAGNADGRHAREVRGDGEDVREVHRRRVLGPLSQPECYGRRGGPNQHVETLEGLVEVPDDQRADLL